MLCLGVGNTVMSVRGLLLILSQGIVADFWGVGYWLFHTVSLNDKTVLIFIIVLFMWENTNILCLFFLACFKTGSCCNLEILWIQNSKWCTITIKENGKIGIWDGTAFERIC